MQRCVLLCYKATRHIHTKSVVPMYTLPGDDELVSLYQFIKGRNKMLVVSGAGLSTESGIPDYRSDFIGRYTRHEPIKYQHFIKDTEARKYFWARNYAAWTTFAGFRPNISHTILRNWESARHVYWLITQNVDMLHIESGSRKVTELHGSSRNVVCLSCGVSVPRKQFQTILQSHNPTWDRASVDLLPDGDVNIPRHLTNGFQVPNCSTCGGMLKPDVVFFGENLPRQRVDESFAKVDECDGMLVLGSSLEVQSAYRLVRHTAKSNKPIAIVNIGPTRADHVTTIKISSLCSKVLQRIDDMMAQQQLTDLN